MLPFVDWMISNVNFSEQVPVLELKKSGIGGREEGLKKGTKTLRKGKEKPELLTFPPTSY